MCNHSSFHHTILKHSHHSILQLSRLLASLLLSVEWENVCAAAALLSFKLQPSCRVRERSFVKLTQKLCAVRGFITKGLVFLMNNLVEMCVYAFLSMRSNPSSLRFEAFHLTKKEKRTKV